MTREAVNMQRSIWMALAVIVVLSVVGVAVALLMQRASHTFAGVVNEPAAIAFDFTLTDENGQVFALSQLRGYWILLTYGYTSCPDICPTTLANLRQVKQALGPEADQVRVVFVSLDPERDTPDILRRYLSHFGEGVKGLTGAPGEVAAAAKEYGVKYEKKESTSAAGYLVSHSAYVYLIDPQFRWRVTYPFGVQSQEIASDLGYLIAQHSREKTQ